MSKYFRGDQRLMNVSFITINDQECTCGVILYNAILHNIPKMSTLTATIPEIYIDTMIIFNSSFYISFEGIMCCCVLLVLLYGFLF